MAVHLIPNLTDGFFDIGMIFTDLPHFILQFVYFFAIHIPLVLINGFYNIFVFFTRGFTDVIFGVTIGSDGKYSYNFNWHSPFATLMIFIFAIALVMFIIVFLMSWGRKDIVDSAGAKVGAQSARFASFRWPILMALMLIAGPFFLVTADTLLSVLITAITGAGKIQLTQENINQLKHAISDHDGLLDQLGNAFTVDTNGTEGAAYGIIEKLNNISTKISSLETALSASLSPAEKTALSNLHADINKFVQFFNPSNQQTESFLQIKNRLVLILNNLQPGFINGTTSSELTNIVSKLTDIQNLIKSISMQGGNIHISTIPSGGGAWSDIQKDIYEITRSLSDMSGNGELGYYFGYDVKGNNVSIINQIIMGSSEKTFENIGLSTLASRVNGMQEFNIVEEIYMFITGDPNGKNWKMLITPMIKQMQILNVVLGAFSAITLVSIMYTFTNVTIKRTFYIVGYWIMGWLFIGQAVTQPDTFKNWYKRIYARWIEVLILYLAFQLVASMYQMLKEPVYNAFVGVKVTEEFLPGTEVPVIGSIVDDLNVWASFVTFLLMETGLVVGYNIAQAYSSTYGAQQEGFTAASVGGMMLSSGVQTFAKGASTLRAGANTVASFGYKALSMPAKAAAAKAAFQTSPDLNPSDSFASRAAKYAWLATGLSPAAAAAKVRSENQKKIEQKQAESQMAIKNNNDVIAQDENAWSNSGMLLSHDASGNRTIFNYDTQKFEPANEATLQRARAGGTTAAAYHAPNSNSPTWEYNANSGKYEAVRYSNTTEARYNPAEHGDHTKIDFGNGRLKIRTVIPDENVPQAIKDIRPTTLPTTADAEHSPVRYHEAAAEFARQNIIETQRIAEARGFNANRDATTYSAEENHAQTMHGATAAGLGMNDEYNGYAGNPQFGDHMNMNQYGMSESMHAADNLPMHNEASPLSPEQVDARNERIQQGHESIENATIANARPLNHIDADHSRENVQTFTERFNRGEVAHSYEHASSAEKPLNSHFNVAAHVPAPTERAPDAAPHDAPTLFKKNLITEEGKQNFEKLSLEQKRRVITELKRGNTETLSHLNSTEGSAHIERHAEVLRMANNARTNAQKHAFLEQYQRVEASLAGASGAGIGRGKKVFDKIMHKVATGEIKLTHEQILNLADYIKKSENNPTELKKVEGLADRSMAHVAAFANAIAVENLHTRGHSLDVSHILPTESHKILGERTDFHRLYAAAPAEVRNHAGRIIRKPNYPEIKKDTAEADKQARIDQFKREYAEYQTALNQSTSSALPEAGVFDAWQHASRTKIVTYLEKMRRYQQALENIGIAERGRTTYERLESLKQIHAELSREIPGFAQNCPFPEIGFTNPETKKAYAKRSSEAITEMVKTLGVVDFPFRADKSPTSGITVETIPENLHTAWTGGRRQWFNFVENVGKTIETAERLGFTPPPTPPKPIEKDGKKFPPSIEAIKAYRASYVKWHDHIKDVESKAKAATKPSADAADVISAHTQFTKLFTSREKALGHESVLKTPPLNISTTANVTTFAGIYEQKIRTMSDRNFASMQVEARKIALDKMRSQEGGDPFPTDADRLNYAAGLDQAHQQQLAKLTNAELSTSIAKTQKSVESNISTSNLPPLSRGMELPPLPTRDLEGNQLNAEAQNAELLKILSSENIHKTNENVTGQKVLDHLYHTTILDPVNAHENWQYTERKRTDSGDTVYAIKDEDTSQLHKEFKSFFGVKGQNTLFRDGLGEVGYDEKKKGHYAFTSASTTAKKTYADGKEVKVVDFETSAKTAERAKRERELQEKREKAAAQPFASESNWTKDALPQEQKISPSPSISVTPQQKSFLDLIRTASTKPDGTKVLSVEYLRSVIHEQNHLANGWNVDGLDLTGHGRDVVLSKKDVTAIGRLLGITNPHEIVALENYLFNFTVTPPALTNIILRPGQNVQDIRRMQNAIRQFIDANGTIINTGMDIAHKVTGDVGARQLLTYLIAQPVYNAYFKDMRLAEFAALVNITQPTIPEAPRVAQASKKYEVTRNTIDPARTAFEAPNGELFYVNEHGLIKHSDAIPGASYKVKVSFQRPEENVSIHTNPYLARSLRITSPEIRQSEAYLLQRDGINDLPQAVNTRINAATTEFLQSYKNRAPNTPYFTRQDGVIIDHLGVPVVEFTFNNGGTVERSAMPMEVFARQQYALSRFVEGLDHGVARPLLDRLGTTGVNSLVPTVKTPHQYDSFTTKYHNRAHVVAAPADVAGGAAFAPQGHFNTEPAKKQTTFFCEQMNLQPAQSLSIASFHFRQCPTDTTFVLVHVERKTSGECVTVRTKFTKDRAGNITVAEPEKIPTTNLPRGKEKIGSLTTDPIKSMAIAIENAHAILAKPNASAEEIAKAPASKKNSVARTLPENPWLSSLYHTPDLPTFSVEGKTVYMLRSELAKKGLEGLQTAAKKSYAEQRGYKIEVVDTQAEMKGANQVLPVDLANARVVFAPEHDNVIGDAIDISRTLFDNPAARVDPRVAFIDNVNNFDRRGTIAAFKAQRQAEAADMRANPATVAGANDHENNPSDADFTAYITAHSIHINTPPSAKLLVDYLKQSRTHGVQYVAFANSDSVYEINAAGEFRKIDGYRKNSFVGVLELPPKYSQAFVVSEIAAGRIGAWGGSIHGAGGEASVEHSTLPNAVMGERKFSELVSKASHLGEEAKPFTEQKDPQGRMIQNPEYAKKVEEFPSFADVSQAFVERGKWVDSHSGVDTYARAENGQIREAVTDNSSSDFQPLYTAFQGDMRRDKTIATVLTQSGDAVYIDKKTGKISMLMEPTHTEVVNSSLEPMLKAKAKQIQEIRDQIKAAHPEIPDSAFENIELLMPETNSQHFVLNHFKVGSRGDIKSSERFDSIKTQQQTDNFSCGVWAIQNATDIIRTGQLQHKNLGNVSSISSTKRGEISELLKTLPNANENTIETPLGIYLQNYADAMSMISGGGKDNKLIGVRMPANTYLDTLSTALNSLEPNDPRRETVQQLHDVYTQHLEQNPSSETFDIGIEELSAITSIVPKHTISTPAGHTSTPMEMNNEGFAETMDFEQQTQPLTDADMMANLEATVNRPQVKTAANIAADQYGLYDSKNANDYDASHGGNNAGFGGGEGGFDGYAGNPQFGEGMNMNQYGLNAVEGGGEGLSADSSDDDGSYTAVADYGNDYSSSSDNFGPAFDAGANTASAGINPNQPMMSNAAHMEESSHHGNSKERETKKQSVNKAAVAKVLAEKAAMAKKPELIKPTAKKSSSSSSSSTAAKKKGGNK